MLCDLRRIRSLHTDWLVAARKAIVSVDSKRRLNSLVVVRYMKN
jgi:hypothetical protein